MAVTNSNKNNDPFLVEGIKDAYITRVIPIDSKLKTFKTIRVPVTNNLQTHLDYNGRSKQFVLNKDGRTLTIYKRNLDYVPLVDSEVKDNNDNTTSNKRMQQAGYSIRRDIPSSLLSNQSIDVKVDEYGFPYFNFRRVSSDVVEKAIRDLYQTTPPKPDSFIYNQPAKHNNNPILQSNVTNTNKSTDDTNNSINYTNNYKLETSREEHQKSHPFQNYVTISNLARTRPRNIFQKIGKIFQPNIYTDNEVDDKVDLYIYPVVKRNFFRMSPETALKLLEAFNSSPSNTNKNVDTLYSAYKLQNTQTPNGGFYDDRDIYVSDTIDGNVYLYPINHNRPVENAYFINKSYLDSINKNYNLLPAFTRYNYFPHFSSRPDQSAPIPITKPKFGEKSSFTKLRDLDKEILRTPLDLDAHNVSYSTSRLGNIMTIHMPHGTKLFRALNSSDPPEFIPIF